MRSATGLLLMAAVVVLAAACIGSAEPIEVDIFQTVETDKGPVVVGELILELDDAPPLPAEQQQEDLGVPATADEDLQALSCTDVINNAYAKCDENRCIEEVAEYEGSQQRFTVALSDDCAAATALAQARLGTCADDVENVDFQAAVNALLDENALCTPAFFYDVTCMSTFFIAFMWSLTYLLLVKKARRRNPDGRVSVCTRCILLPVSLLLTGGLMMLTTFLAASGLTTLLVVPMVVLVVVRCCLICRRRRAAQTTTTTAAAVTVTKATDLESAVVPVEPVVVGVAVVDGQGLKGAVVLPGTIVV